jgi:hypothetical protein
VLDERREKTGEYDRDRRRPPIRLALVGFVATGALAAALAASCSPGPTPSADDVVLPLTVIESPQATRVTIPVRIGNGPWIDAVLDTGSSGLRVSNTVVGDAGVVAEGGHLTYRFHDNNTILEGTRATATVTLGSLGSPTLTIPGVEVMIVTEDCHFDAAACAGGTSTANFFSNKYSAILGVNLTPLASDQGVVNPLLYLDGGAPFVVALGDAGAGTLSVTLNSREPSGFRVYTLPLQGTLPPLVDGGPPLSTWNSRGLPTCLVDPTSEERYCALASLDTGNPEAYIESADGAPSFPAADVVDVLLGADAGADGAALGNYALVLSSPLALNQVHVELSDAGFMNMGVAPFLHYDVLMNPSNGHVGLRGRD